MELKFLFGFAFSLLGTLFGNMVNGPEQGPPPKEAKATPVVIEQKVKSMLKVPKWVNSVPSGHFAGVSAPSRNLAEARKSAVSDVVRQILGSVGVSYRHVYYNKVSGDPRRPVQQVSDSLSGIAHGLVFDVESSIAASSYDLDRSGRYVAFLLVAYPAAKIADVRRLSRGAKVTVKVVGSEGHGYGVRIRATEAHGVAVVLSSADIRIVKVNRFAKLMSFFWNVEDGSEQSISVPVGPVHVCSSSSDFLLDLGSSGMGVSDYLLGAQVTYFARIRGHDEVGRVVEAKVRF